MEIVSGLGEKPHVTSQQFRQIIEGTIGQKSYIVTSGENLEPELAANNLLKIRSGMMSHHGNISSVKIGTYDEVELTNGSQGMKRIDLVVNRYTRNAETNIEKNEWVVIMGTPVASNPVAPAYTVGNLQKGDLVDDCPVFELHYDGINVTEVKKMLSVLSNVAELNSKSGDVAQNNVTQQVYNLLGGALIVVGGTKKLTLSGSNDYLQLFANDELRELFGSEFDQQRLTIITNNGDALAANIHLYEPEYWKDSGNYYQYYYPKVAGDCRINYLMVYRPAINKSNSALSNDIFAI